MGFQLPELPQLVSFAGFLVAFDQRNASGAQQGMNLIMAPKDGTYPAPHGGGNLASEVQGLQGQLCALKLIQDDSYMVTNHLGPLSVTGITGVDLI